MRKFIIGFFSVLLFLIIGIAVYFFTFDIDDYKSRIEKTLNETTGYTFVFNGRVKATRSFDTIVDIDDVEIKSANGFENEPLLTAKHARIFLDLKSLLKDVVIVKSMEFTGVNVSLRANADGEVNWSPAQKQGASASKPALKKTETPEKKITVMSIVAKNVNVSYNNSKTSDSWKIEFPDLTIQQLQNLAGKAIFRGEELSFSGSVSNLPVVIQKQKNLNLSMDITASFGNAKVALSCRDLTACRDDATLNVDYSGHNFNKAVSFFTQKDYHLKEKSFDGLAKISQTNGILLVEGDFALEKETFTLSYNEERNVEALSTKGRIDLTVADPSITEQYGVEPFSLKANYSAEKGKIFELSNISSMFNETDIDGSIRIDLTGQKPKVDAQLHSHYFKLDNVLYSPEKEKVVEEKNVEKLFSQKKIDWSFLNKFNGSASVVVDNLSVGNMLARYPQVLLDAKLDNGVLDLELKEGSFFAGGEIVGKAMVKALPNNEVNMNVDTVVQGIEFSQVVPWKKVLRFGNVVANIFVKTKGNSVADLLGNLNGPIVFAANQIDITSPVIRQLLSEDTSSPTSRISQELFIKCAVINIDVKNGLINLTKNMALETSKFNMIISGDINLKDEKLSLQLIPMKNKYDKTKDVNQSVAFEGSFVNPQSRVITQAVQSDKPEKVQQLSEKQAFLNSYTKKVPVEDTSAIVCRTAMGTTVMKDINAFYGRDKEVAKAPVVEPVQVEEQNSRAREIGRRLLDSLSDVLSQGKAPTNLAPAK